jgi:hypothetical protein
MDDYTTREAVSWIFNKMGFNKLAEDALNENTNIDIYINYIKYVDTRYKEVREFINYYL